MPFRFSVPITSLTFALVLPVFAGGGVFLLSGCEGVSKKPATSPEVPIDRKRREALERQGVDAIQLFDFGGDDEDNQGGGMTVNRHLWHASLQVLSFLPLDSVDAEGGVIITEWSTLADAPGELMKVVARIQTQDLRIDGIKVKVFRRMQDDSGNLQDVPVDPATERALEDRILTEARRLLVSES